MAEDLTALLKRKRDDQCFSRSNVSTAFSASTKNLVKKLNTGDTCWYCEATPTDVCHVILKTDHEFETYASQGLSNICYLSDIDNGIPLCPLCCRNFDDLYNPGFIFVPTDIAYFISCEVKDKARRQKLYNTCRIWATRRCPTPDDYRQYQLDCDLIQWYETGGLYERYNLRDYFPKLGCCQDNVEERIGQFLPSASWHGDPMAALRRAFAVTGTFPDGIPMDVIRQLQELHNLYIENDRYFAALNYEPEETEHKSDIKPQIDAKPTNQRTAASGRSRNKRRRTDRSAIPSTSLKSENVKLESQNVKLEPQNVKLEPQDPPLSSSYPQTHPRPSIKEES